MRRAPVCDAASIGSPDDRLGGQWAASPPLALSLSVTEAGSRGKRGWKEREGGRMMQSVELADTADNAASPMDRNTSRLADLSGATTIEHSQAEGDFSRSHGVTV